MINPNEKIQFRNVVSKRYRIHYLKLGSILKSFHKEVSQAGGTIKPSYFYALENVPKDEIIQIEVFAPIEEDYIEVKNEMKFHSYFSIDDMIGIHLVNNFEEDTEIAYAMLFSYMKQHQLEQITPIYHVFTGDESFSYVTIKIGTVKKSNESVWK